MNILWITNIMMPPLCSALGLPSPAVGGWMFSSLEKVRSLAPENRFAVATVWAGKEFKTVKADGITYYLLPLKGKKTTEYNSHLEAFWKQIEQAFRPDVVHLHGSEYPHGLAYVRACGSKGVIVSIQGVVSSISRYYTAGIEHDTLKKCLTFRDFIKHDSILRGQKTFETRGETEKELFQSVSHVIGRTDWDRSHALAINPQLEYHFCGETLRPAFYKHKWHYNKCEPYSIFVSQASYPIKGLHMLLKAMPLILRKYPKTRIYVAGGNIMAMPWYRMTGYAKYIRDLVYKLEIGNKIEFIGLLNEEQMCERYLKSNVFVCPSSIENSPNSLGEAQLLGMPYVASFVGGIPEIVAYNAEVLYRFEEYEMLAERICNVFEKQDDFRDPSDLSRYDGYQNAQQTLAIYNKVAGSTYTPNN